MPKPFQYKSGSLIYCTGEESDKVFILQSGKVLLSYTDIETGENVRDQVQPGEFFGVKSALGHFPREESALTQADSTIMAFTVSEFEALAMSNTRIIFKMLKVFSNQLRRIHAQVFSLLETEDVQPDKGLFAIGERYLKNKRYDYARYIFSRYLICYPGGEHTEQAAKNLRFIEAGFADAAARRNKKAASEAAAPSPAAPSPAPSSPPPKRPSGDGSIEKAYYDAVNLISQQKYQDAMQAFNHIIQANENQEWTERSAYEAGHCLFLLEKFEECVTYYTKFIIDYPEYPDKRDAMFYVGQSYEKMEDEEKAMAWYKKIITLSGDEKDGTRSRAVKAYKALGGE